MDIEHPEITWAQRTGYLSWMQDDRDCDCDCGCDCDNHDDDNELEDYYE